MDPEAATVCPPWQSAPRAAVSASAAPTPDRRERPRLAGELVPAGPPRAARRRSRTDLHRSGHAPSGAPAATWPSPLAAAGATHSREAPAATNTNRPAWDAGH